MQTIPKSTISNNHEVVYYAVVYYLETYIIKIINVRESLETSLAHREISNLIFVIIDIREYR